MPLLLGTIARRRVLTGPPVAGYFAWWDAADTASLVQSGGAVSQWNDKSGNARHLSQATAANRPTTGTRTIGGKNALDFDGLTDLLVTAAVTQAQPVTVFAVAQADTLFSVHIVGNNAGSPTLYIRAPDYGMFAGLEQSGAAFADVDTAAHVWAGTFNGASSTLHIDGASVGISSSPGTTGWSSLAIPIGNNIGGTTPWDGLIAEVIIYPSALSAGNRASVESYLKTKWGTP